MSAFSLRVVHRLVVGLFFWSSAAWWVTGLYFLHQQEPAKQTDPARGAFNLLVLCCFVLSVFFGSSAVQPGYVPQLMTKILLFGSSLPALLLASPMAGEARAGALVSIIVWALIGWLLVHDFVAKGNHGGTKREEEISAKELDNQLDEAEPKQVPRSSGKKERISRSRSPRRNKNLN